MLPVSGRHTQATFKRTMKSLVLLIKREKPFCLACYMQMYVFNKLFLIISSSTNNSCGVQMETRLYVSAEFQTCKLFVKYHLEKTLVQMRILVVNISALCFPELHATLETLRQRHRQRSGLCSRGTLCQSYFFRRQQSFCECLMMFCTPSPSFPPGLYTIFSTEMFVRLKIWSPRSNGPLKTA